MSEPHAHYFVIQETTVSICICVHMYECSKSLSLIYIKCISISTEYKTIFHRMMIALYSSYLSLHHDTNILYDNAYLGPGVGLPLDTLHHTCMAVYISLCIWDPSFVPIYVYTGTHFRLSL